MSCSEFKLAASQVCVLLLMGTTTLSIGAPTRAAECSCGTAHNSSSWTSYRISRIADSGLELSSVGREGSYSIRLTGSNTEDARQPQNLKSGEASRKSIDVDANAKLGTFVKTELHTNFTEAWRDPGDSLRSLQVMSDSGNGSRALSEFDLTTQLWSDRIVVSSKRQSSTWQVVEPYRSETSGLSEQHRFRAILLKSDFAKFAVEGASGRVGPNYSDLTRTSVSDPLLTKNRTTHELRSNLDLGRFRLNAFERNSAVLVPEHLGDFRHRQSEVGTTASVKLSDLRNDDHGHVQDSVLFLMPDSIWFGENQGTLRTGSLSTALSGTEKLATGATRNWTGGNVSISYWQSTVGSGSQVPDASRWTGHGLDAGGNLSFGRWRLYANMSVYSANTIAAWSTIAEKSVNGSLLVTWAPLGGPSVTAGLTSYRYGSEMFEYAGFDGSELERYEVAADFSRMASARFDREMRLKLLLSYRAGLYESQWADRRFTDALGRVFMGFRFGVPLQS